MKEREERRKKDEYD